jgi:hypothetical protein
MSSLVVWKSQNIEVNWNKGAPYSVHVLGDTNAGITAARITYHRNEKAAIKAAKRKEANKAK